jgi:hypothetical protein
LGAIASELEAFKIDFDIASDDFDGDGLPEEFALTLLTVVCDRQADDPLRQVTLNAFEINQMALEFEEQPATFEPFKHVFAALMLLSSDTQTAATSALTDNGVNLTGVYEVVTTVDGEFMPSAIDGQTLAEGYLVFDFPTEPEDEPYSGSGDLDGDGFTNLEEYLNTAELNGTPINFAYSADDPTNDGTQLDDGGEGEGEGEGMICFGSSGASPSLAELAIIPDDFLLLGLVAAAMLLMRRKKPTR